MSGLIDSCDSWAIRPKQQHIDRDQQGRAVLLDRQKHLYIGTGDERVGRIGHPDFDLHGAGPGIDCPSSAGNGALILLTLPLREADRHDIAHFD